MVEAAMVLLLYAVQLIGHTSYSDCEESCSKTVSIFPRLTNNLKQRGCWKVRLPRGKIFVPDGQLSALYGATAGQKKRRRPSIAFLSGFLDVSKDLIASVRGQSNQH